MQSELSKVVCEVCCVNTDNLKVCKYCESPFYMCVECILKYLEGRELIPHCMCCKHEWDFNFMLNNMFEILTNKNYMESYAGILYKEINHILASQPDIKKYTQEINNKLAIRYYENYEQKIKDIVNVLHVNVNTISTAVNKKFMETREEKDSLFYNYSTKPYRECYKDDDNDYSDKGMLENREYYNKNQPNYDSNTTAYVKATVEYRRYVHKIMAPYLKRIKELKQKYSNVNIDKQDLMDDIFGKCTSGDCEGIVYKSDYKCTLCKKQVCQYCNILIELHKTDKGITICNKSDIESFNMIAKETVKCPKCLSLIYKISGCNQMFCTKCFTAFDWETKKITTSHIHNPHYFEYLKNKSKILEDNPQNIRCDILDERALIGVLSKKLDKNMSQIISDTVRQKNIFADDIQQLQTYLESSRESLNTIIISYYFKFENDFENQLLCIDKKDIIKCRQELYNKYIEIQYAKELIYINQMYVQVLTDILVKLQFKLSEAHKNIRYPANLCEDFMMEISEFAKYTQDLYKSSHINSPELFIATDNKQPEIKDIYYIDSFYTNDLSFKSDDKALQYKYFEIKKPTEEADE